LSSFPILKFSEEIGEAGAAQSCSPDKIRLFHAVTPTVGAATVSAKKNEKATHFGHHFIVECYDINLNLLVIKPRLSNNLMITRVFFID
jgi:hypothetical protein